MDHARRIPKIPERLFGPIAKFGNHLLVALVITAAALTAVEVLTQGVVTAVHAQDARDLFVKDAKKAAKAQKKKNKAQAAAQAKAAEQREKQARRQAKAAQKARQQAEKAQRKAAKAAKAQKKKNNAQAAAQAKAAAQREKQARRQAKAAKKARQQAAKAQRKAAKAQRKAANAQRKAVVQQRKAAKRNQAEARAGALAAKRKAAAARKPALVQRKPAPAGRAGVGKVFPNGSPARVNPHANGGALGAFAKKPPPHSPKAGRPRRNAVGVSPQPTPGRVLAPKKRQVSPPRAQKRDLADLRPSKKRARAQRLRKVRKLRRQRRQANGNVVIDEPDGRSIVRRGRRTIIRNRGSKRLHRNARDVRVVQGPRGTRKKIVTRANGTKIITEFDSSGRLVRRIRRGVRGRDVVLINNKRRHHRGHARHERRRKNLHGFPILLDLLAPRVHIPHDHYIVDSDDASDDDIYDALSAPPIDHGDDVYTLDEVRYNHALRARMRRIDISTINFDFGSWYVDDDEYEELEDVARAIKRILRRKPDEIFFVEGHTDAVGTFEDNLSLSDRRAEAVAVILSDQFSLPSENLVTQGYGEEFLKVRTQGRERRNRRVSIRRITPLIKRHPDRYSSRGTNPWDDDETDIEPRRFDESRDDNDDDDAFDDDDARRDNDRFDRSDRSDGADTYNDGARDRSPWDQSRRSYDDDVERFVAEKYLSGQELTDYQLRSMYAPRIDHFGRRNLTISKLIQKKQEYYDRWPSRRYELDDKTLRVEPGSKPGTYDVTFEYTFDVRGKGRVSRGRGKSNLVIAQNDKGFTILREDGKVLQKN